MIIALTAKNKLGFVDGSIISPHDDGSNEFRLWRRNNTIVISWILNSVSKEISASVMFASSAREMWLDLKDRFQQRNGPRIFQLHRELMNLRQENVSVSVYFTKLKIIREELANFRPSCSCGKCVCGGVKSLIDHYHMEYIMAFLMGLSDSFSNTRGQILLMDPLPSINRAFSLVSQEEHQRSLTSSNTGHSGHVAFAINDKRVESRTDNISV